ncbi:MAG: S8 family serine peptidase [Chloroflexaceae bacterium]|nr:S8 family serine peptidase [Chloroflexaceae bacterium]
MLRSRCAPFCLLLLLLVALLPALPALTPPAAAQSGGPVFSGSPEALTATVALGATASLQLVVRNESAAPVAPQLYEALPAPARPAGLVAGARAALPTQAARVDPQIAREQAAAPDGRTEFLVVLADQADLSAAYAIADWGARGAYVYRTLRDHADRTQRDLRAALDARGLTYRPLWIVNALAVQGAAADVAAIAARADVAAIRANHLLTLEGRPASVPAQTGGSPCGAGSDGACWHLNVVGASRVWSEFGVRGEGITVANIDSGVRYDHPALIGQYRGSTGAGANHNYNWYDLFGDSPVPVDSGDHGTHTMGLMAARGLSPPHPAVGVAPGARWIAVRACSARECGEVDLIRAAEWLLAPTDLSGANPRPELRPQVVNNSWTAGQNANWYAGYVAAWRAAGIYPVFAAGNSGNQTCGTVQSPGDYADVTAVGAVDATGGLTGFSSIGPTADGRVKPDLTAPGSGIYSTIADPVRLYGFNSGTSMATPHVAGAVALIWSARPDLIGDYDATYAILTASAAPRTGDSRFLGPSYAACQPVNVPNNIYGYGRLDTYAAVARARVDVPWLELPAGPLAPLGAGEGVTLQLRVDARRVPEPGRYQARVLVHGPDLSRAPLIVPVTLDVPPDPSHATITGRVTHSVDGQPLRATVTVVDGASVSTDAEGRYRLVVPPVTQPYTLEAAARDYTRRSKQVTPGPGAEITLDFSLDRDVPRLVAETTPRSVALGFAETALETFTMRNEGTRALTYTVRIADEAYGVWRSDEPDGPAPAWTEPPPDAVQLNLTDDGVSAPVPIGFAFPYRDGMYQTVSIGANGFLSLAPIAWETPFARTCLPLPETSGAAIAPLRVDLDPSRDGAMVSYARLAEGFLVNWVNVPLYREPATRLSFQALLLPDGRISLRYRQVGRLPAVESASYGVQYDRRAQTLGCGGDLNLNDGLTLELRPQTSPRLWLQVEATDGRLGPGTAGSVPVRARWISPTGAWPASGAVEVRTNDPARPRLRFTVRLSTSEAPYRKLFPWIPSRR